jgi:hypothetical protein
MTKPSLITRIMLLLPRLLMWLTSIGATIVLVHLIFYVSLTGDAMIEYAVRYVAIGFLVNMLAVIVLVAYASADDEYGDKIRRRTAHMFWNVPLVALYIFIMIVKFNT